MQINNATASPSGGAFSTNPTIDDGTGTLTVFTGTTATFAAQAVPSGPKTWIGNAVFFNTEELKLRRASDVF